MIYYASMLAKGALITAIVWVLYRLDSLHGDR